MEQRTAHAYAVKLGTSPVTAQDKSRFYYILKGITKGLIRVDKETSTKIKNEYIRKGKRICDLSRKYGVSQESIQRLVNKEGWKEKRAEYQKKREEKTIEKIADADANNDADISRLKADIRGEIFMQINSRLKRSDLDEADFRRLTQCYKDMCDIEVSENNADENKAFVDLLNAFGGVSNAD